MDPVSGRSGIPRQRGPVRARRSIVGVQATDFLQEHPLRGGYANVPPQALRHIDLWGIVSECKCAVGTLPHSTSGRRCAERRTRSRRHRGCGPCRGCFRHYGQGAVAVLPIGLATGQGYAPPQRRSSTPENQLTSNADCGDIARSRRSGGLGYRLAPRRGPKRMPAIGVWPRASV
jgi:hypothetical protein